MNYLPIKLNKLRKHYNYSQQYVADKLGVDVVEYMNYENGNSMISYGQMKKLASLYHVSVNEIFKNSEEVELHEVNGDTDSINARYFMPENNIRNKIKGFVINHKIATIIIGILLLAIIILSIIVRNITKPYVIKRENINRLSVSDTTVIYIEDSGALGFSGSNENGQLNDLAVTSATKVCEGEGFSVVLNEDGSVVSSGLISKYEKEVAGWRNIVDIAAGSSHVVGVDANGKVYCAGDNEACEIEGTRNIIKVFATENASIALSEVGTLTYTGQLLGSSYLSNFLNIKDIASSDNILVILNSDNTLNVYSKSGSYLKSETWTDIVDVACGDDFVAGLDAYGKVYIEIDNDDIQEKVSEWSNIVAIASGKDYLIGFDGKNIYGVGNNRYNQFVKEEKQKITLEKVKNIEYTLTKEMINIQFDGVSNSSGYIVSIDVGTGLSSHIDDNQVVSFTTENMIEGKTYNISIVSLGSGDYKDSDAAILSFVYNRPEDVLDVNTSQYIGSNKEDFNEYLDALGVIYKEEIDEETICSGNNEVIVNIDGLDNGQYSESELKNKLVKYTYCKVVIEDEEQQSVED